MNLLAITDPALLLSIINTKLRDFYPTLEHLCEDMQIDEATLINHLNSLYLFYYPTLNQLKMSENVKGNPHEN